MCWRLPASTTSENSNTGETKTIFEAASKFPPWLSPNMVDANPSQSHRKRPFPDSEDDDDDEESHQRPTQKRVRFPKGKKVKKEDDISAPKPDEDDAVDWTDPRIAAKERAKRRNQITAELFSEQSEGILGDVSTAEVHYEGNGNFEDDGILIEPFNLKQEREEGYFDAEGNFVEYVSEKEIKDAWLDSVEVDTKFAGKANKNKDEVEEFQELSSEEIGRIKRRIANILQPGETVLQALRRLKGMSNDKKERMPEETKRIFDQLTEDSMKLMENGDYNVYHEKQEVFQQEAEGYECLARARESGTGNSLDMFGDDENDASDQPSNMDATGSEPRTVTSDNMQSAAGEEAQSDYIYDESSGYYYSSSLGYYYDPASGLYCCATSGKWYSFNEQTGSYDEIRGEEATQAI